MRRQHKRITFKKNEVSAEIIIETEAVPADMGLNGIGLKTSRRLIPGRKCILRIEINGSNLILRGTSIWERSDGLLLNSCGQADTSFSAGIKIENTNLELLNKISGEGLSDKKIIRIKMPEMAALLCYAEPLSVINLGCDGMLAESFNHIETGAESSTSLFLPASDAPVKCIARVIYCRALRQGSEQKYRAGFKFTAMDSMDAKLLKAFIRMRSAV